MSQHDHLACKLAPHLRALSTASATLFTPLTSVITALVTELASLRAAHHQLQARLSRIEASRHVPSPNSIPPLPETPPRHSPAIDPELTQPPLPIHDLTHAYDEHPSARPLPVLSDYPLGRADPNSTPPRTPEPTTSTPSSGKRLRRRRRSSKRPLSDSTPSAGTSENRTTATALIATPAKPLCPPHNPKYPSSPIPYEPVTPHVPSHRDEPTGQPMEVCHAKSEPLEEKSCVTKILPTTPTTHEKPKKRKTDILLNDPVIEGYKSAAAAVKEAENIIANQEAESCPQAFRTDGEGVPAKVCAQCQNAFRAQAADAFDPHEAFQALVKGGCSHQEKTLRPRTPEGYWDLDFSETPTQSPPNRL